MDKFEELDRDELYRRLREVMVSKLGKYRKYNVERAVDCFIRKNVLCIEYNPVECEDNPLLKELRREFMDLVKMYRPKDCSIRRFSYTVRYLYRRILQILAGEDLLTRPVKFTLDLEYLNNIYPFFKHYNPICVAVALASLAIPDLSITRICDVISSSEYFHGCDPGSLTGMVYKARNMIVEKGLNPFHE